MRLAFTHAYSWPEVRRGGERLLHEIAAALAGRGHAVTVFTAGASASTTNDDGVRIVKLKRRFDDAIRHEVDFAWRLLPRLRVGSFDAVHAFGPHDAVAAIRSRRLGARHRTAYTNLGIPTREWWSGIPYGRAHRTIVDQVDLYGCLSRYAVDVLRDDWGRAGVMTPGGVDLAEFNPADAREPVPTILYSGALDERRKGVADLLAAVGRLAEHVPDVHLWLSGPGDPTPLLAAAPAAAAARTEVLPLGAPHGQRDRYARAWVTAVPAQWEAFGLVLLESLACGTPVVVADHAALPELVEPGVTGILAPPGDSGALATALAAGLELTAHEGVAKACRDSAAEYDWRRVGAAYEALYS